MLARVLRAGASLLVGVGMLLTAAPAAAADRIDRIAEGLRASPLYVDPDAAHLVAADERERIRAALGNLPFPVYIAVVPLLPEDESGGDEYVFLRAVQDRVGEDGIYVVADTSLEFIYQENYGVPVDFALLSQEEIWSAANNDRALGERLEMLVQAVAQAPPGPALQRPRLDPPEPPPESADTSSPTDAPTAFWVGALVAGPLTVLLLSGVALVSWTVVSGVRSRRRAGAQFSRAEAPTQPRTGHLRRLAEGELASLRDALGGAEQHPGWQRAATAYDAAALLWAERKEAISLLGVVVLARCGRSALSDPEGHPRRPCYINPLHGPAVRERAVGLLGQEPRPVPVCAACWDASRRPGWLDGRVLLLDDGGRRQPYYLIDGLWGDGSGLLAPDLPDRVLERLGVH